MKKYVIALALFCMSLFSEQEYARQEYMQNNSHLFGDLYLVDGLHFSDEYWYNFQNNSVKVTLLAEPSDDPVFSEDGSRLKKVFFSFVIHNGDSESTVSAEFQQEAYYEKEADGYVTTHCVNTTNSKVLQNPSIRTDMKPKFHFFKGNSSKSGYVSFENAYVAQ